MYDSLSYGTLAPIAERLAREIFAMTGLGETLITHENDYSVVAGIVMREIELLMTAEFITLRSSEYHRERQREAEARDDEACKELEQFPDYVRNDPTDESQAQLLAMVREASQVNALSERPSVNAPEAMWCNECNCRHTLWGCDNLKCEHCYEEVETLHIPTGAGA
jgi:hypothetical protein